VSTLVTTWKRLETAKPRSRFWDSQGLTHFAGSQLGPGQIAEIYTLLGEILSGEKHAPGTNALLGETLSRETHAPGRNILRGEHAPRRHAPGRGSPRKFAVPGL